MNSNIKFHINSKNNHISNRELLIAQNIEQLADIIIWN